MSRDLGERTYRVNMAKSSRHRLNKRQNTDITGAKHTIGRDGSLKQDYIRGF